MDPDDVYWPDRVKYEEDGKTIAYSEIPNRVELLERIEKAKAALAYFGPQGDQIIGILEGKA